MNEIEQMFQTAYENWLPDKGFDESLADYISGDLEHQKPVGIYRPDFVLNDFIIEIDGHEYHKTKEQREKDYQRERYFQKKGYKIIRFMGTEVFLDANKCATEVVLITSNYWFKREADIVKSFQRGMSKNGMD